jgi:hypothetical protein
MRSARRRLATLIVAGALVAVEAVVVGRRRGSWCSTATPVRCRSGHLFTTTWIPGVSLKALKLGWWRLQRCPVGRHFALVTPLEVAALTDEQRRLAAATKDRRIP